MATVGINHAMSEAFAVTKRECEGGVGFFKNLIHCLRPQHAMGDLAALDPRRGTGIRPTDVNFVGNFIGTTGGSIWIEYRHRPIFRPYLAVKNILSLYRPLDDLLNRKRAVGGWI